MFFFAVVAAASQRQPPHLMRHLASYSTGRVYFDVMTDILRQTVADFPLIEASLESRGEFSTREDALFDLWKFNQPEFEEIFKTLPGLGRAKYWIRVMPRLKKVVIDYLRSPPIWKYLPRDMRTNYYFRFSRGYKYTANKLPERIFLDGGEFMPFSYTWLSDNVIAAHPDVQIHFPLGTQIPYQVIDMTTGESAVFRPQPFGLWQWKPEDRFYAISDRFNSYALYADSDDWVAISRESGSKLSWFLGDNWLRTVPSNYRSTRRKGGVLTEFALWFRGAVRFAWMMYTRPSLLAIGLSGGLDNWDLYSRLPSLVKAVIVCLLYHLSKTKFKASSRSIVIGQEPVVYLSRVFMVGLMLSVLSAIKRGDPEWVCLVGFNSSIDE